MTAIVPAMALAQDSSTPYAGDVRTYRDIVEPKTPTDAVWGFIDAWRREDYFTAVQLLSGEAKMGLVTQLEFTFDYSAFLPKPEAGLGQKIFAKGNYGGAAQQFDQTMRFANAEEALPFTFGQRVSLGEISSEAIDEAVVEVKTDGMPAHLSVRLIRWTMRLGRMETLVWQVDQIIFDGSDKTKKPWGFPNNPGTRN